MHFRGVETSLVWWCMKYWAVLVLAAATLALPLVGGSTMAQPATATVPASAPAVPGKGIEYARVDGRPLVMDLYLPKDVVSPPVVMRLTNRRELSSPINDKLLAKGYAVAVASWMPEGSEGFFGGYPRDFYACKAAVRHIRANAAAWHVDGSRIGVYGNGNAATLAALLGVTGESAGTEGRLGDHLDVGSQVRAVALIDGETDWRNAELYGDESVNDYSAAPYQFFSANIKEVPTLARQASAINYVRPRMPPVFMVDTNPLIHRGMYATWVESLKRAGVPVTFSEAAVKADFSEDQVADDVAAFFDQRLKPEKSELPDMTPAQEVDALIKAGLYKQARRIIDENLQATGGAGLTGAGATTRRDEWRKLLMQVSDNQAEAMAAKLIEARKSRDINEASRAMWSIREVVTDPTRLGQFQIEAVKFAHEFDNRATLYRQIDQLNKHVQDGDWPGADRMLKSITELTNLIGDKDDQNIIRVFAARYAVVRANAKESPPGIKLVSWASDFGQDLYGYWMDMRVAGVVQRFRYVPPGKFKAGSSKDEWGRQPDEPELKEVEIAKGFWLGEAECSQEFYEAVMGAEAEQSFFRGKQLPVENVSFQHVIAFMQKLGVESRMPTQEEYEYACRAGTTGTVAGTGRLGDMAWFWDEGMDLGNRGESPVLPELARMLGPKVRNSHPIKTKLPNAWGLYDMQGNVWEWCVGSSSVHGRDWHVARGGGFNSIPESCRPARAAWFSTEHESWNIGFRILVPAQ